MACADIGQGFTPETQFAVWIVFDERNIVFRDDIPHGFSFFQRIRQTGRILKIRYAVNQLDRILFQQFFQFHQIKAVFFQRHGKEFRFTQGKGLNGAQITRFFHQNLIALVQNDLAEQFQRLL